MHVADEGGEGRGVRLGSAGCVGGVEGGGTVPFTREEEATGAKEARDFTESCCIRRDLFVCYWVQGKRGWRRRTAMEIERPWTKSNVPAFQEVGLLTSCMVNCTLGSG